MAATQETYYFGQAKVYGQVSAGKWAWWGDFSTLNLAFAVDEQVRHKESYSGKRGTVRRFDIGQTLNITGTMHQFDPTTLARFTNGTVTSVAGGSVVGETLPAALAVGDIVKLDNPGVTLLTIVDSAGAPATYPAASYALDAGPGSIEILVAPGALTQPLKASYTYAARKQLAFLNALPADIPMRVEAINLAENGAPVVFELYKVSTSLVQQLPLITNGTDVAGTEITAEALLDSSKLASGTLGQFGRFLQVAQS